VSKRPEGSGSNALKPGGRGVGFASRATPNTSTPPASAADAALAAVADIVEAGLLPPLPGVTRPCRPEPDVALVPLRAV
jgi:hypothetical protein